MCFAALPLHHAFLCLVLIQGSPYWPVFLV
jgi:hypothetical protein